MQPFLEREILSMMQTFLHGHSITNRSSPAGRSVLSSTERLRCDHELSCCFSNTCRTSWTVISPQSCSHSTPTVSPCRQVPRPAFGHKSLSCFPGQLRFSFSDVLDGPNSKGRLRFVVLCRCVWGEGRHGGHLQQPLQGLFQHQGSRVSVPQ